MLKSSRWTAFRVIKILVGPHTPRGGLDCPRLAPLLLFISVGHELTQRTGMKGEQKVISGQPSCKMKPFSLRALRLRDAPQMWLFAQLQVCPCYRAISEKKVPCANWEAETLWAIIQVIYSFLMESCPHSRTCGDKSYALTIPAMPIQAPGQAPGGTCILFPCLSILQKPKLSESLLQWYIPAWPLSSIWKLVVECVWLEEASVPQPVETVSPPDGRISWELSQCAIWTVVPKRFQLAASLT